MVAYYCGRQRPWLQERPQPTLKFGQKGKIALTQPANTRGDHLSGLVELKKEQDWTAQDWTSAGNVTYNLPTNQACLIQRHATGGNEMHSKSIRVAVLAGLFLATSVLFVAAQDHAMTMKEHQLTKKEVKALIVGAQTPEDHMKLASYFRGEAQRQEASAKYHDEMAELYKANRTAKVDMAKHCKYFADEARKAAEAANSMAGEHEKMAAEVRGNK